MKQFKVSPGGDAHFYTSVHQWKPIQTDRFTQLLFDYGAEPQNTDDFGNGLMITKAFQLDRATHAIIHYSRKHVESPIRSPVLMMIRYGGSKPKIITFASLIYGIEADPDRFEG
jgi:hypothetical protein